MVSRDRGQLILVGAIAIALILLGLVLIVNTALFTQIVGSEGTTESVKEGGVSGQEIGNAVAAVVAAENRNGPPSINNWVQLNVSNPLEPAITNRSIESGGSIVSVEYLTQTASGARIGQDGTETFEDANSNPTWYVVNGTERADIGEFVLVIDTTQSTLSSDFEVNITGTDTNTTTVTVRDTGGPIELEVNGPSTTITCSPISPTNETVHLDVTAGRVYEDGSCQFDAFEHLDPGYSVEFVNGDQVEGTWELVTDNSSIATNSPPRFSSDPSDPTRSSAVWAFEYRFSYDTGDVTVESDRRGVDVYD